MVVSILPVILGEGIRRFPPPVPERHLRLVESKAYESGLVSLRYFKARKPVKAGA